VRLGLNWGTALAYWICADGRTPGNVLRMNQTRNLHLYRYDSSAA
jgi:hypothetical protein